MYFPTLDRVKQLAADYNFIPVRMKIMADEETPISIYQKFRSNGSFLLESVEGGSHWARYSFIGTNPFMVLQAKKGSVKISRRGLAPQQLEGNPIEILRQELAAFRSPILPELPRFSGGAVGYFGFDILQYYEDLPEAAANDLNMDDVKFIFSDEVIVFDHLKQEIQVIAHVLAEPEDTHKQLAEKYDDCCKRIRRLAGMIRNTQVEKRDLYILSAQGSDVQVNSNLSKKEFTEMVRRAKEYIASGDIFQVVLSQRFEIEEPPEAFQVYRVLRSMNPSPYMYFVQFTEDEIVAGTSPELLVRVEDGKVENRPIAGTRKRGLTPEQDAMLREELLADKKELAEHLMLVDLGRNDLGRVSHYGSVNVEQFMEVELYSHVMHIVSHVTGKLASDKDAFDALISCFPAGTVSGAPKLRAMEIIAELEPLARNAYAGAIGYFSFTGNMDSCITIRTIVFRNGRAYIQAGAGIVADSIPELEYEETENKAKALIRAIEMARQIQSLEEEADHVSAAIK